jgi:hypothetical protein
LRSSERDPLTIAGAGITTERVRHRLAQDADARRICAAISEIRKPCSSKTAPRRRSRRCHVSAARALAPRCLNWVAALPWLAACFAQGPPERARLPTLSTTSRPSSSEET